LQFTKNHLQTSGFHTQQQLGANGGQGGFGVMVGSHKHGSGTQRQTVISQWNVCGVPLGQIPVVAVPMGSHGGQGSCIHEQVLLSQNQGRDVPLGHIKGDG